MVMITISDEQLFRIKNVVQNYDFSGEHFITNADLDISFKTGMDAMQATVNMRVKNFFMNKEYIGIEDGEKKAGFRNIEFKIRNDLKSILSPDQDVFLLTGYVDGVPGIFPMVAEKEWSLNHDDALDVMYKKYPATFEKNRNKFSVGVNTSQFWGSYLKDANPLFVDPYRGNVFLYEDAQLEDHFDSVDKTSFNYFPFVSSQEIGPDLTLESRKDDFRYSNFLNSLVPVHFNNAANRVMGIGLSRSTLEPIVAFYSSQGFSKHNLEDESVEKMLKSFGNIALSQYEEMLHHPFSRGDDYLTPVNLDEKELAIHKTWSELTKQYSNSLKK